MNFSYFSRNGELLPIEQATVPLADIAYAYGYGVYETIRVKHGVPYFLPDHAERLLASASIIGLEHPFSATFVSDSIRALIQKTEVDTCNLKVMLIGGTTAVDAALYVMGSSPLFPDRKLYRDGAICTIYRCERAFPNAKTLNMLQSYLAYRDAKANGAYDALLINRADNITEGTRTNFFCLQGRTIISSPEDQILFGITRKIMLKVAGESGFQLEERDIPLASLKDYAGAFITSTSTGIMPVRSVGDFTFGQQPAEIAELRKVFNRFMDSCGGEHEA